MSIKHNTPFYPTKLEDERVEAKKNGQSIGVWFNTDEIEELKQMATFYQQEKPGTLIKAIYEIGLTNLKDDKKMNVFRDQLFKNTKNNKRHGIVEIELKLNNS